MIATSIMKELKSFSKNFLYETTVRYLRVFSYRTTGLGTKIVVFLNKLSIF